jgi:hypothetical protein
VLCSSWGNRRLLLAWQSVPCCFCYMCCDVVTTGPGFWESCKALFSYVWWCLPLAPGLICCFVLRKSPGQRVLTILKASEVTRRLGADGLTGVCPADLQPAGQIGQGPGPATQAMSCCASKLLQ